MEKKRTKKKKPKTRNTENRAIVRCFVKWQKFLNVMRKQSTSEIFAF